MSRMYGRISYTDTINAHICVCDMKMTNYNCQTGGGNVCRFRIRRERLAYWPHLSSKLVWVWCSRSGVFTSLARTGCECKSLPKEEEEESSVKWNFKLDMKRIERVTNSDPIIQIFSAEIKSSDCEMHSKFGVVNATTMVDKISRFFSLCPASTSPHLLQHGMGMVHVTNGIYKPSSLAAIDRYRWSFTLRSSTWISLPFFQHFFPSFRICLNIYFAMVAQTTKKYETRRNVDVENAMQAARTQTYAHTICNSVANTNGQTASIGCTAHNRIENEIYICEHLSLLVFRLARSVCDVSPQTGPNFIFENMISGE